MSRFDVTGIVLNATDAVILVPHFPPYAGKVAFDEEMYSPGGQVASTMVQCAKLGLRTKYICPNQTAYIIIDRTTGERTVF